MEEIVLIGSGGFAKEVIWLIYNINQSLIQSGKTDSQIKIIGCIDNHEKGSIRSGNIAFPILGDDDWAFANLKKGTGYVIGIGNPDLRRSIAAKFGSNGFRAVSLIDPSVKFSEDVVFEEGCVICANVVLTVNIKIGRHVIINLSSTVGHDSSIGDFTNISPGSHISGNVRIGLQCELGTGAILLPGIEIGDGGKVGAGAVVTKNVGVGEVVAGVPAKKVD